MLRASVVALVLMIAPTLAAPPSPFWFEQMAKENGTPDTHGAQKSGTLGVNDELDDAEYDPLLPEWRANCGEPGEYTDSRCDPASPDFVSIREFDDDYDPDGQDKYLYTDYPNPGDEGYDEYVQWYLDGQDQSNRPAGMTDGEYVEWLEAGCGDEPTC